MCTENGVTKYTDELEYSVDSRLVVVYLYMHVKCIIRRRRKGIPLWPPTMCNPPNESLSRRSDDVLLIVVGRITYFASSFFYVFRSCCWRCQCLCVDHLARWYNFIRSSQHVVAVITKFQRNYYQNYYYTRDTTCRAGNSNPLEVAFTPISEHEGTITLR